MSGIDRSANPTAKPAKSTYALPPGPDIDNGMTPAVIASCNNKPADAPMIGRTNPSIQR
jgi:hypothetical protein